MSDRVAYLNALVSQPWTEQDHCWAFVAAVQRDLFGIALPAFGADLVQPGMRRARMEAFAGHEERANWIPVGDPRDGDIVLMTRRTSAHARDSHAGVYLVTDGRGLVWHSDAPHGVTADTLAELTELRRWQISFYRHASGSCFAQPVEPRTGERHSCGSASLARWP